MFDADAWRFAQDPTTLSSFEGSKTELLFGAIALHQRIKIQDPSTCDNTEHEYEWSDITTWMVCTCGDQIQIPLVLGSYILRDESAHDTLDVQTRIDSAAKCIFWSQNIDRTAKLAI